MTKLLEQAVEAFYRLTDEDRAVIEASRAEARRGEFVSEREMEEFWRGYGA